MKTKKRKIFIALDTNKISKAKKIIKYIFRQRTVAHFKEIK